MVSSAVAGRVFVLQPAERRVVEHLAASGGSLKRWRNGKWTDEQPPASGQREPEWWVGTVTVRGLHAKRILEPATPMRDWNQQHFRLRSGLKFL